MVNFTGSKLVDTVVQLLVVQGAVSAARTAKLVDGSLTVAAPAVPKFSVGATWQIILRQQLKIPPSKAIQPDFVDVWDIDLFENTNDGTDGSTIAYLKNLPHKPKVICYFSAGSYEEWRTDWPKDFDKDNYGSPLEGWDGEYWLDLGSSAVQEVMFNRIRLAAKLGCDAVDPDNVDGYGEAPTNKGNRTGKAFTITEDKTVTFMTNLAKVAHENNIAIGLKNALEVLPRLQNTVDFAVNEQCVENNECSAYATFTGSTVGKPVFHIEYPNGDDGANTTPVKDTTKWCSKYDEDKNSKTPDVDISKLSTVIKDMDLDGWVEFCDKREFRTELED